MKKSITQFFKRDLGAPLVNQRWSWGSQAANGTVYLRVWLGVDQHTVNGERVFEIGFTDDSRPNRSSMLKLGGLERLQHIKALREGQPGFMVMARPVDPDFLTKGTVPVIASYIPDRLARITGLVDGDNGAVYATYEIVPVSIIK